MTAGGAGPELGRSEVAGVASWLAVDRTQIERMTRRSTTETQPSGMCITILRLARSHSRWRIEIAPGTRYQTVLNVVSGCRKPLPYR